MDENVKTIELSGRQIDLNKALPLVLKDWRQLEAQGITATALGQGKVGDLIGLLFHVLNKADPTVKVEEIEAWEMSDPRIMQVIGAINTGEAKVDRPS